MSFGTNTVETPKTKSTFRDRVFYVVVGFFVLSTIGSLAKIANPEGAARREQIAQQQAKKVEQKVASTQSSKKYNVVEVVTACDMVTKKSVKNPSSLSTAWSWQEVPTSRGVTIYRNFTAMNGFGANLDSYYVCTFDAIDRKFVNYEIREGNY